MRLLGLEVGFTKKPLYREDCLKKGGLDSLHIQGGGLESYDYCVTSL